MNKEEIKFKELMNLLILDEISEEDKVVLKQHLNECEECKNDFEEYNKVKLAFSSYKKEMVTDQLLNEARIEFKAHLRKEINKGFFLSTTIEKVKDFIVANWKNTIGYAFTLSIGIIAGTFLLRGNETTSNITNEPLSGETRIQDIKFLDSDASDGEIEFEFNAVKPMVIKGNVNDTKIQNVLAYSMINSKNIGTRLHSLNVLETEPKVLDKEIKDALLSVIKYDNNSGVRKEAIDLLKGYKYDNSIKDVLLYVIKNDTVSGMRISAINILAQGEKERTSLSNEDINVLKQQIEKDDNSYVRIQAQTVLKEYR